MIVTVHRTYRSALTRDVVDATTQERWDAFLDRLTGLAVNVEPFTSQGLAGVTVTCATQRGIAGAHTVHTLACNYGALAVVE